ncbi:MAG TPA: hypothetical protein VGD75_12915, partial [Bradyrhizobium sp.]
AELIAQRGGYAGGLRHLSAATAVSPYSEIRRALSSLSAGMSGKDLFVWDSAGLDADALGKSVGWNVQRCELSSLGVASPPDAVNGSGSKYAAAVALALTGIERRKPQINFLRSRLAPVKERRIPRWWIITAVAALLVVGGGLAAYISLRQQEAAVEATQKRLDDLHPQIVAADAFVSRVSFAQGWHGGDPRYLGCLKDLTLAIPDDGQTYATNLVLHETPHAVAPTTTPAEPGSAESIAAASAAAKAAEVRTLNGSLYGKTSDQQQVLALLQRLQRVPSLSQVKLGGTNDAGRGGEVIFSITFTYAPPKGAAR